MATPPSAYRIASLISNDDGTLSATKAHAPAASDARIAVIFHLFYLDVFEEACRYLDAIGLPFDLLVSVPEQMDDASVRRIFELRPDACVYRCENRGRDVLPFLQVLRLVGTSRYDYICKLHTKKTGGSALGEVWRKLLYFDLIGSDETVRKTVEILDNDANVCMVTGKNTILDSRRYDYGNTAKIDRLLDAMGVTFQDHYTFAGGTMFWTRPSLFAPVLDLFERGELHFEEERGQKDNTLAHALERLFGILCKLRGGSIVPAPTRYSELDDATLDLVASLVLSQQYHGEDVFHLQHRTILDMESKLAELNEELLRRQRKIDELEELADLKRRFKKSVKRYVPSPLWKTLKLGKQAVVTLKRNPAVLRKVLFYLKRGEFGHIIRKIKEKSEHNLNTTDTLTPIVPQRIFKPFNRSDYDLGENVIDIVIPVYNGFEFLPKLFDSIEKHTTSPYRLIVVNDAGDDPRVLPFLKERLARFDDAVLIEHDTNLGFVKSVNEAVFSSDNHVVILNTDTEVPAFWLERLMYPVIHGDNVASTTPFTNAGTIASFPEFLADNPIFEGLSVERLDRVFRRVNPDEYYEEIPTGVGFCMGVNRHVIDAIGFFDEEAFGKGYGEENDWCQRAVKAGYTNLLVPNLFVYHKHGGSFSAEEKAALLRQNALKLLEKHPDYEKQVQAYIAKDPHKTLREVLALAAASKVNGGLVLMFDHALGGGANIYAKERLDTYIRQGEKTLYVAYDFYSDRITLRFDDGTRTYGFRLDTIAALAALLDVCDIKEIFVNSLVSFKEITEAVTLIRRLQAIYNARVIVPVHDYFPVCPNYTLLDDTGTYCGVPEAMDRCRSCMTHNTFEWQTFFRGKTDIERWRELWRDLLRDADEILCFSHASKTIMTKAYPDVSEEKYSIVPHTVPPLTPPSLPSKTDDEPFVVGILGAINHAKGATVVKELLALIDAQDRDIRIVLIGNISEPLRHPRLTITGRYTRDELPTLVETYRIDLFFIPSIWPETFSYTTEEIMTMQLPLMVYDLGAPAERVKHYEKGMIIPEVSAESALETILAYLKERS